MQAAWAAWAVPASCPDDLRAEISKINAGTDRPFAVNLLLPESLTTDDAEQWAPSGSCGLAPPSHVSAKAQPDEVDAAHAEFLDQGHHVGSGIEGEVPVESPCPTQIGSDHPEAAAQDVHLGCPAVVVQHLCRAAGG
jgi:hypothetical protein